MIEHTQGPWTTRGPRMADGAPDYAILSPDGEIIGEAFGRSDVSRFHPSETNAKLMAAAPRMYAALKFIVEQMKEPANAAHTLGAYIHGIGFDMAVNAIKDADGKP